MASRALVVSNKTYRKAVAKIDRWFTWNYRSVNGHGVMWCNGVNNRIHIMVPNHWWMRIIVVKRGKEVVWDCKSYSDLNKVLHMIEFMAA